MEIALFLIAITLGFMCDFMRESNKLRKETNSLLKHIADRL